MQYSDINFTYVRHGNDYVFAFDIPGFGNRYHGYTQNKLSNFHVYDETTRGYTTYQTQQDFNNFLAALSSGNYSTTNTNTEPVNNIIEWTGLPEVQAGGTKVTPFIIIGALAVIYFLYTR